GEGQLAAIVEDAASSAAHGGVAAQGGTDDGHRAAVVDASSWLRVAGVAAGVAGDCAVGDIQRAGIVGDAAAPLQAGGVAGDRGAADRTAGERLTKDPAAGIGGGVAADSRVVDGQLAVVPDAAAQVADDRRTVDGQ